jgi:hypothetical protein
LAPYFTADLVMSARLVMSFYKELVKVPIPMRPPTNAVAVEGGGILGHIVRKKIYKTHPTVSNNSYNSMDFTRFWFNVLVVAFGVEEMQFDKLLWAKMLKTQAKRPDAMLKEYDIDMSMANELLKLTKGMNWTTFLFALCELRQAREADDSKLYSVLARLDEAPRLRDVARIVDRIVQEGAQSLCYCVRAVNAVAAYLLLQWHPPLRRRWYPSPPLRPLPPTPLPPPYPAAQHLCFGAPLAVLHVGNAFFLLVGSVENSNCFVRHRDDVIVIVVLHGTKCIPLPIHRTEGAAATRQRSPADAKLDHDH